jgi:hypothetical protein
MKPEASFHAQSGRCACVPHRAQALDAVRRLEFGDDGIQIRPHSGLRMPSNPAQATTNSITHRTTAYRSALKMPISLTRAAQTCTRTKKNQIKLQNNYMP